jgi:hypothetical protein
MITTEGGKGTEVTKLPGGNVKVYVVKSFCPEEGYCNIQAFYTQESADRYVDMLVRNLGVKRDTDEDAMSEHPRSFLEVEELELG